MSGSRLVFGGKPRITGLPTRYVPPRLPARIQQQVEVKLNPTIRQDITKNMRTLATVGRMQRLSEGGGGGGGSGGGSGGGGIEADPLVGNDCLREMIQGYCLTHYWEAAKYQMRVDEHQSVDSAPDEYQLPTQECKTKCQKLGKKLAEFELQNWDRLHGQLNQESIQYRLMELLGLRNSVKDQQKASQAKRAQLMTE